MFREGLIVETISIDTSLNCLASGRMYFVVSCLTRRFGIKLTALVKLSDHV